MPAATVSQWDELPGRRADAGPMGGEWSDLGRRAGSVATGLRRIRVDPGKRSTPVHRHEAEEELFYVLSGTGLSWQDGAVYEVGPDDCILYPAVGPAHTLIAGSQGIDVLAFGTRRPSAVAPLPRAGVAWDGSVWFAADPEPHPWAREAAAGELAVPAPSPRPPSIVATQDVDPVERGQGDCRFRQRDLGRRVGSVSSGLRHVTIVPGMLAFPPHVHSAEEEIFVVLEGSGVLHLYDCYRPGTPPTEQEVRPGSVVAFPAGQAVAHAFKAGGTELTLLAYGERRGDDICFYPRSQKLAFGAFGLVTRVPRLSYWDDEPPAPV